MKQPDQMSRVWHGAPIDLSAWRFFDDDNVWRDLLMAGFAVSVTKTLRTVLQETPPSLSLPFGWTDSDGIGGNCPDDPATLYLGLPLGETDDCVYWSISLERVIDDLIGLIESGDIHKVEGEVGHAKCFKIAARLRELADKLENACVDEASAAKLRETSVA